MQLPDVTHHNAQYAVLRSHLQRSPIRQYSGFVRRFEKNRGCNGVVYFGENIDTALKLVESNCVRVKECILLYAAYTEKHHSAKLSKNLF